MMLTGSTIMVNAENSAKIEYRFEDARAGYAQGTVTFTASADGEFDLYWADDTAALSDWFRIASVTLNAGERGSYRFGERVAIPAQATKLIAVESGTAPTVANAAAVYEIPVSKRFPYAQTQKSYRFAALSDIHIDVQDGGKNVYYTNASKNFARALEVCHDRAADFIITAGDQVTNASGTTLEWLEYQRILASSSFDKPVYEAIGNHEMRFAKYSSCDVSCGIEEFIINTGLDGTAEAMAARKLYFEITEPTTGDHFIFMALENGSSPNEYDEFSDEQIAWVEGLLKQYSADGHKIFLIQHSAILGYGAGDDHDNPAYGGSMNTEFPNNKRFRELIEEYKDVVWFSGHTHIDFADNVNYSDEGGTACKMFHIPSVAGTTRLIYDEKGKSDLDRTFYDDTTQGYLVDVYDGATVLGGVNFFYNKFYPAYSYIVGDTQKADIPIEPSTDMPFVYGDADCNGVLDILDAAAIQRHIAELAPLSPKGYRAAMVSGYDELNIIDATAVQRKLAGLIDAFAVERRTAPTGASDVLTTAKAELSAYYQYASYPAYAALKRAYNASDETAAASALSDFRALREHVRLTTVYWADELYLNNVRAYVSSSVTGEEIEASPGQKMTFIENNSSGFGVFALTVDTARYDTLVLSNGRKKKSVDIPLTDQSGRVYYPISSTLPFSVSYDVFEQNWFYDDGETAEVYFTDTENWGKAYVYAWTDGTEQWPGTAMTYVSDSAEGKPVYRATVPKNAKVIFTDGAQQTADIPVVADGFGYYPYRKNADDKWQVIEYRY